MRCIQELREGQRAEITNKGSRQDGSGRKGRGKNARSFAKSCAGPCTRDRNAVPRNRMALSSQRREIEEETPERGEKV